MDEGNPRLAGGVGQSPAFQRISFILTRFGSSLALAFPLLSLAIDCFGRVSVGEMAAVRGDLITHVGFMGCFPSPRGSRLIRQELGSASLVGLEVGVEVVDPDMERAELASFSSLKWLPEWWGLPPCARAAAPIIGIGGRLVADGALGCSAISDPCAPDARNRFSLATAFVIGGDDPRAD